MTEEMQFDRAETVEGDGRATCSTCQRPIESSYFASGGRTFCPDCKARIEKELTTNTGNFPKAVLFGAGGAFAGAVLYFGVTAITGYEIGLIAIAVGWLVGRAMQKGSGGHGGRRFQLVAVLLTYLSISGAYFGMLIKEVVSSAAVAAAADSTRAGSDSLRIAATADSTGADRVLAEGAGTDSAASDSTGTRAGSGEAGAGVWVGLLLLAFGLPIMSAFASMPGGLIGLLIIFIGLHQAWRMNQKTVVEFLGPFAVEPPKPAGAAPDVPAA